MRRKITPVLITLTGVLIGAFAYYWDDNLTPPRDVNSDSFNCSIIEDKWTARTGKDSIYAMQEDALFAIDEGNIDIASCTLNLAVTRARKIQQDLLAYKLAVQLAELYTADHQYERARSTLISNLEHLDRDSETQRIRRIETYLDLIAVSKLAGDKEGVRTFLDSARDEMNDLQLGMLVKDRVFLAEMEYFESIGDYSSAAESAQDLLELRREWSRQMPSSVDPEYVEAARKEYERLAQLRDRN